MTGNRAGRPSPQLCRDEALRAFGLELDYSDTGVRRTLRLLAGGSTSGQKER